MWRGEKLLEESGIWNLINGDNKLYGSIVNLSLYNNSTTSGENNRYVMNYAMITNGMNLLM